MKFEQYFTLIWSFSRSFIVYFPFVSLAPRRPFWGMKKHPLNFNEMNSIFERCVTNKAIGAKRQRNKKKNLVKRDHHKISFSSWWLIRMQGGRWEADEKVLSIIHIIIRLRSRTWMKRIIPLSLRPLFEISFHSADPSDRAGVCCWWLLVKHCTGSVALGEGKRLINLAGSTTGWRGERGPSVKNRQFEV